MIEEISPSKGIPSTTYNGLLLDAIEPIPRIRTVAEVPGWPLLLVVCTPATLPDNGLLLADKEPTPRIRTVEPVPGCPLPLVVCTPATCPESAFDILETWRSAILSALIVEAEPVNWDFFAVP